MDEKTYKEIQEYLTFKLKNNPYTSSWKTEEAYEKAILSVKSKIKSIYEQHCKINENAV